MPGTPCPRARGCHRHGVCTLPLPHGEKILATITDVQFVSQPEGIYRNEDNSNKNPHKEGQTARIVQVKAPLFRIEYRFNPGNDENPEDLTHAVYTRTPPEDHYRVGDALPILYLVEFSHQNGRKTSTVYSTPFPLPMHGSLSLDGLVGQSTVECRPRMPR